MGSGRLVKQVDGLTDRRVNWGTPWSLIRSAYGMLESIRVQSGEQSVLSAQDALDAAAHVPRPGHSLAAE